MIAVRIAEISSKGTRSLEKKAASLWRRLSCSEEAADGCFDDTYCMCRFLQKPLNRALDSALEHIASPCATGTVSEPGEYSAEYVKSHRNRLHSVSANSALKCDSMISVL